MSIDTSNVETILAPSSGRTSITLEQQTALNASRETHLRWLGVFHRSFRHRSFLVESRNDEGELTGHLPLCLVKSRLFGRFLVSLPYLNTAGVSTPDSLVATQLIERCADLADELDVQHLELRHNNEIKSPIFNDRLDDKVQMRLRLPAEACELWDRLKPKVRNQVRKGAKHDLRIEWGRENLVADFYAVFSRNMRDLGTPVYSRLLFENIIDQFPDAEFAVTYLGPKPIAAAYLNHTGDITSVPSASSLRDYKSTNANMWMYWELITRAIQRGALEFDFGRSTLNSGPHRFKKQWGAVPYATVWQIYRRKGNVQSARPTNPKYNLMIKTWRRLPLWLANGLGPHIVRGIP
jgi:FemAB-related protein (PEP-CTERM system-associated)